MYSKSSVYSLYTYIFYMFYIYIYILYTFYICICTYILYQECAADSCVWNYADCFGYMVDLVLVLGRWDSSSLSPAKRNYTYPEGPATSFFKELDPKSHNRYGLSALIP